MAKKLSLELIIPDNFDGADTLLYNARAAWHKAFRGSQDYIDSNVIVWDNRNTTILDDSFTETGLIVDFGKCQDKIDADTRLRRAISTMLDLESYGAMTCGVADDIDDESDKVESEDSAEDYKPLFPPMLGKCQL